MSCFVFETVTVECNSGDIMWTLMCMSHVYVVIVYVKFLCIHTQLKMGCL